MWCSNINIEFGSYASSNKLRFNKRTAPGIFSGFALLANSLFPKAIPLSVFSEFLLLLLLLFIDLS